MNLSDANNKIVDMYTELEKPLLKKKPGRKPFVYIVDMFIELEKSLLKNKKRGPKNKYKNKYEKDLAMQEKNKRYYEKVKKYRDIAKMLLLSDDSESSNEELLFNKI